MAFPDAPKKGEPTTIRTGEVVEYEVVYWWNGKQWYTTHDVKEKG